MKRTMLGSVTLLLMLLAPAGRCPAADDFTDFDDEDFKENVSAEPIDWRPVIKHLYLQARAESAAIAPLHFQEQQGVLPSLIAAWQDLGPKVRYRSDEQFGKSFADNEAVISGWRLNKEGTGFDIHAGRLGPDSKPPAAGQQPDAPPPADGQAPPPPDPMKQPINILLAAGEVYLHVGLDVLMNVEDPAQRDEILNQFFKLDRMIITMHHISDDPTKFLDPPEREPMFRGGLDRSDRWPDIRDRVVDLGVILPRIMPGCYAFRVDAAVSGRVDASEDFGPAKQVQAEIRVSFVGQSVEIHKLSWDTQKKTAPSKPKPGN